MIQRALTRGLRRTVSGWRYLLPLWLTNLLLGLLAIWPLYLAFGGGLLHRPFLRELALDPMGQSLSDVVAELGFSRLLSLGVGWLLSLLGLLGASGVAYNFFAGGVLSRYAQRRAFWPGCRRFFWPFTLLGLLAITTFGLLTIVLGYLTGRLGWSTGVRLVLVAVVAELLNTLFEYVRVLVVLHDEWRGAIVRARRFCWQHAGGVLLFVVLSRLALAVVLLLYSWVAARLTPLSLVVLLVVWRHGCVLVQQWLKFLRLAWAGALAEPTLGQP